jgi:two-component system, OmpR family, response regulator
VLIATNSMDQLAGVEPALRSNGFEVEHAHTYREALAKLTETAYEAIVVYAPNFTLHDEAIVKSIRAICTVKPIVMMSWFPDPLARLAPLRVGADATFGCPIDANELCATIEALVRRRVLLNTEDVLLRAPGIQLNLLSHKVTHGNRIVTLRPTAFRLLVHLMKHQGQPLSRDDIQQVVWDKRPLPAQRRLDTQICLLRRDVDIPGTASRIHSVRSVGYMFR